MAIQKPEDYDRIPGSSINIAGLMKDKYDEAQRAQNDFARRAMTAINTNSTLGAAISTQYDPRARYPHTRFAVSKIENGYTVDAGSKGVFYAADMVAVGERVVALLAAIEMDKL